jgi:hypothetical protein
MGNYGCIRVREERALLTSGCTLVSEGAYTCLKGMHRLKMVHVGA